MRLRLSFLLCLVPLLALHAQFADGDSRHQVRISTGIAFDDALLFTMQAPTIGIGYEYRLSKRWGAAAHLLSYYRDIGWSGTVTAGRATAADLIIEGLSGPFITQMDLDAIASTGIRKIRAGNGNMTKFMSIPIDVGLNFYPLRGKRHQLGINGAISATYESYNLDSGAFPAILEFENGAIYRDIFFVVHKEFRHWVLGLSVKLFYEYHFKRYAVGLRAGNYNVLDLSSDALGRGWPIWESSLYFTAKF